MLSNLGASYMANWLAWTTSTCVWSWWNWTRVWASGFGECPLGICICLLACFSHPSMLHTQSYTDKTIYIRKLITPQMKAVARSFFWTLLEREYITANAAYKHTWESAPEETRTFRTFENANPVTLFWWPFNLLLTCIIHYHPKAVLNICFYEKLTSLFDTFSWVGIPHPLWHCRFE